MRDPSKRKKLKGIPGYFEVCVTKEPGAYPSICRVLDPSLEPVITQAKINEVCFLGSFNICFANTNIGAVSAAFCAIG